MVPPAVTPLLNLRERFTRHDQGLRPLAGAGIVV
jgi:hypothetical protein